MKSVFFKYFMVTSLIIMFSFILLGASFLTLFYQYMNQEQIGRLDRISQILATYSTRNAIRGGMIIDEEYTPLVTTLAGVTDTHVLVCDLNGMVKICTDSDDPCPHLNRYIGDPIKRILELTQHYRGVTNLNGLFSSSQYSVGRAVINSEGTASAYIFVSTPSSSLGAFLAAFLRNFTLSAIGVLFFSTLTSYYITRRLISPVRIMARAAEEFSHGEFKTRVPTDPDRKDEIAELALAFNSMAQALEKNEQIRRDFIANVSHEIKTPMTTIAGYVGGILDGTIPEEKRDAYLKIIYDETHRMSRLVNRMLELSRLQSGAVEINPVRFDLVETASRILVSAESRIAEKNLSVVADFPETEVYVLADLDAVNQIIRNLLDNAIKFSYAGNELVISITTKGQKAYMSIQNTGEPIPPSELSNIFDRFHKTDYSRAYDREGLGLGLYIVRAMLNAHKEDAWVKSVSGVTTFTFSLTLDSSGLSSKMYSSD